MNNQNNKLNLVCIKIYVIEVLKIEMNKFNTLNKTMINKLNQVKILIYIMIMSKTIDITPKWEHLIHVMIEVLQNPKASVDSKREIRAELVKMAKVMDQLNEEAKQNG